MSGADRGRGVGRGRGKRKLESLAEPDKAALEKINQEKASLANRELQSPPTPDQTADADSATTTTGEGKPPPLVEELKEAVRGGLHLESAPPPHPSVSGSSDSSGKAILFNKLNPTAPEFTPSSITAPPPSTISQPMFTKHSEPTPSISSSSSSSSTTSSKLDPHSKEFIPREVSLLNGNPDLYGNGEVVAEDELLEGMGGGSYWDAKTILRGFERAAPTDQKDPSSDPILKGAAEMLSKVFYYPGSFEDLGQNFQATLSNWEPSEDTLINLAEMLVYWGVTAVDLRYAACRVSFLISGMKGAENFKKLLLKRLQAWHRECYAVEPHSTEGEKFTFANYSGFCAEVFAKFVVGGEPIEVIGPFIFKYVQKLFALKEEHFVREACNILKLTGNNLVGTKGYDTNMSGLVSTMKTLTTDENLSSTCVSLVMQVLELYGTEWSAAASPVKPPALPETTKKMGALGLNTNATPFIPSDAFQYETFYSVPDTQQPVTCAADWDDFVGEDQPVEGYEPIADHEDEEYDGLDPEIELEMEAFIEEIEEHLMLQDFDPELRQKAKPGGGK